MDPTHSIRAYAPVVRQADDSYEERLQTENETYVITDTIGFDKANFTLTGEESYLKDWFVNGLVRDIRWRGPDGATAWEGFVARMSLTIGGETITRSVEGMFNRVIYVYVPLDTTQNPPEAGAQATITYNDTASQDLYGIKTIFISGNECTAATADDEALSQLKNLRHLKEGRTVTIGTGQVPTLQIECWGYAHMVDWYPYTQTTNTGTDNADVIIVAVLAADPNSVISSADTLIDANTTQIEEYWDGKQTGWKIVQDIAARGYETGGEGFRWTCGVYEGRRVTYKAAEAVDENGNPESTNQYPRWFRDPYDAGDSVLDAAGKEVMPWHIRPDHLLYTNGVPGRPTYIKQVTFEAPWTIRIAGEDALNPMRSRSSRVVSQELIDGLTSHFFARDSDITLQANRTLVLGDGTEVLGSGLVPIGGVIFWPSTAGAIPTGWAVFAALQGRFPVGADGATFIDGADGGAATINIQHNHGGSTGNESAHTHGDGTYATDSDGHDHNVDAGVTATDAHSHDVDAGLTANDSHDHAVDAGTTANDIHSHGPGTLATDDDSHSHGPGTLITGGPSAYAAVTTDAYDVAHSDHVHNVTGGRTGGDLHNHSVNAGVTANDTHSHGPGTLDTDSDTHSHGPGTLATDSDTHSHGPGTLNTDSDSHSHDVTGTSGAGSAHSHTISNALSATQSIIPPYHCGEWIQRTT